MNIDTSFTEAPPVGLCGCGCGLQAPIATKTDPRWGHVKGEPVRFLPGHYSRIRPRRDFAEYFWPKVDKNGPIVRPELGPCWIWIGALNSEGYGVIRVDGRLRMATHIALELAGWIIPFEWLQALHRCDNRPCVRPDHLRIGTNDENVADMVAKGRQARLQGERSGRAKLRQVDVDEILGLYQHGVRGRGYRALAKQFGVTPRHIACIVHGETWKHVDQ